MFYGLPKISNVHLLYSLAGFVILIPKGVPLAPYGRCTQVPFQRLCLITTQNIFAIDYKNRTVKVLIPGLSLVGGQK